MLVAFGAGLTTVVVAIAVSFVPGSARIIRSAALSVREMPYVEAARTVGASPLRIMAYHVAPQCIAPFLINASFSLGVAIFAEAALSFLGLGVPPPAPTWGNMLGGITASLFKPPWWLVVFPGVAITITVLAFNLLGDGLRDYLDPRLRGRLG
jgi:ABC-type dipeptide/oligopeptide/nickel transport system permease subunit